MLSAFGCLFSAWEASMGFAEYSNYDGLGLAELVKKKEVKPAELVEAAFERIERHNPQLNAVVFKAFDEASAMAKTVRKTSAGKIHALMFIDVLLQRLFWRKQAQV